MKRKILALLCVISLLLAVSACDNADVSSKPANVGKVASFTAGKLLSVGDVFTLPDIKTTDSSGSPVIAEVTGQANPGDYLTVVGEGFSANGLKAFIYAQSTAENGKAYDSEFEFVDDKQIVVKIAPEIPYGIYAVYIETANGISNVKFVNKPVIRWNGFTAVKCGESFSVYGENLTTDNGEEKTNAWIVGDGEYCAVEITYADPYKVTFTVPEGLKADSEYKVVLHNGHGGENGFVEAPEKIKIVESRLNDFSGKKLNVVDYGADPDDKENDDTTAIRKAITAAENGDTIYFPKGTYIIDSPISINNKALRLEGESFENTHIASGINMPSGKHVISIRKGPCEITNLSFVNIRDTGKLNPMIEFSDNNDEVDTWLLNVHNCRYTAKGSKYASTPARFVNIYKSRGIVLQNNDIAAPGMYTIYAENGSNVTDKIFINRNRYYGQNFAGAYYDGMNCMTLNGMQYVDISNNYFASADVLIDDTHIIDDGDLMNGRSMSIQGLVRKVYIAKNTIEASDIPGECAGEQIMSEGSRSSFHDNPSAATENSVTLPNYKSQRFAGWGSNYIPAKGTMLYIVGGKGYGQMRLIESISDNVITVNEPWDIIPDETSVVSISIGHYDFVIYKNDIEGSADHSKTGGGGCGIMIYNDVYNFRVVDNNITDVNTGIYLEGHGPALKADDPYSEFNGSYWCILTGNNISKSNVGIRSMMCNARNLWNDKTPFYVQTGISIRRNTISDIVDWTRENLVGVGGVGIMFSRTSGDYNTRSTEFDFWKADWQYGTVIANNSFINCSRANVLMGMYQAKTVLLNNTVSGSVKDMYSLDNECSKPPFICK